MIKEEEVEELTNLEEVKGPLREWLTREAPKREIARRFRAFLAGQLDPHTKRPIYQVKISNMCVGN